MIKKLECDYSLKSNISTLQWSFIPTNDKASISLILATIYKDAT